MMHRKITAQHIPLTPIEQLLADKSNVEAKCDIREQKLQENFEYIRHNASSLLFSGLTSLLFSSGQSKKKPASQSVALINDHQATQNIDLLSFSNLFVIVKKMIPVMWEIVQPLLINWGIKKAKSLFLGLFTKKKKTPSADSC